MPQHTFDPEIAARKARNEQIFKETLSVIRNGFYIAPSGARVELPPLDPMIEGSECIHSELPHADAPVLPEGTTISVEGNDCLETTRRLVEEGYNPALLNFASSGHPGGGVETGARAQEETICRRSTLVRSIYSFSYKYSRRYFFAHRSGNNYPLEDLNHSIIYSPAVTVFREGRECTFMEKPFQCGVITCAALNLGGRYSLRLTPDGRMPEAAKPITMNKIRAILRMGLRHGHDSLVLGAFGCGAFKNPPEEVSELFRTVLYEDEFRDRYRLIVFAIINDHNAKGRNLEAFRKTFGPQDIKDRETLDEVQYKQMRICRG